MNDNLEYLIFEETIFATARLHDQPWGVKWLLFILYHHLGIASAPPRKDAAGRIPCPSSRGRATTAAISLLCTRKERLLRTPKAGVSQRRSWTNPVPVFARESNDRGDLSIVHQKREIASYPKIGVLAKTLGKIVLVINE